VETTIKTVKNEYKKYKKKTKGLMKEKDGKIKALEEEKS